MRCFKFAAMMSMFLGFSFHAYCTGIILGGGMNFSNVSFSGEVKKGFDELIGYGFEKKMRLGYHGEVFFEFPITASWAVSFGPSLQTRGFVMSYDTSASDGYGTTMSETGTVTEKLMYLQLPLRGKAAVNLGPGKIWLAAGPEVSFNLSGELEMNEEAKTTTGSTTFSVTQDTVIQMPGGIRKIDWAIGAQLGYDIPVGSNALVLGGGYSYSLTDQAENKRTVDGSALNYNIQIFLQFHFNSEGLSE